MLKFQILTDKDRAEAASIERRRQNEEERRKRIFNARNRKIGVDVEALEKQIEEKRVREKEEKRVHEAFEQQALRDSNLAMALQKKEEEEKKRIQKEIAVFRKVYQRTEDRREFDIYDPNALKKELPGRLLDDDPRLGLSSAQKFEGEDLNGAERRQIQIEQQRSFLEQQMEERRNADKERLMAEEAYQTAVISRDARSLELERLEKECRKRLEQANARFNHALADEQASRKCVEELDDLDDKHAEMYNTLMSDMMTENPLVAQSNLGPNRCIGYMYKGMTDEQRKAVRAYNEQQTVENKKRREDQKRYEDEWDKYMNGTAQTVEILEREHQRKYRELQKQITAENQQLAKEQTAHNDYLNRVVYSNRPTAAFYEQFNTSTR